MGAHTAVDTRDSRKRLQAKRALQPLRRRRRLKHRAAGIVVPTQDNHMHVTDTVVPLVAILCCVGIPLSIPIVIAVLNYRKRRRLMELYHAERMAAIERGMELPPIPIEVLGAPPSRSTLLPGLVWLFVGLALLVSLREGGEFFPGFGGGLVWGLVPTGIGIAYLIHYFVEGRKHFRPAQPGQAAQPPNLWKDPT
jgi:hypothetical protein